MTERREIPAMLMKRVEKVVPTHLIVSARIEYWEDTCVNGEEDTYGKLIPCRHGEKWEPCIELETGRIVGWPIGTRASVDYEVCDEGEYRLLTNDGDYLKYKRAYVPDGLLCMGDNGYGDYIILDIDETGVIQNWVPKINDDEWEFEECNKQ